MTVHTIIHSSAAAAGGVGGGLAQLPGADAPVLMGIQTALADELGASITKTAAADLVLTFGATMGGRAVSQWALGWAPGLGNAVNASTAAALTEAIGWAAVDWFKSGGHH